MAKEQLLIPEEHLVSVIQVIRAGLAQVLVPMQVTEALTTWCIEEEAYLKEMAED